MKIEVLRGGIGQRSGGLSTCRVFEEKPNLCSMDLKLKAVGAIQLNRKIVVNEFAVESHKTKDLVTKLKEYGLDNVLIVSDQIEENLYLAARNLHKVDVLDVSGLDPVSLIGFDKVLITVPALKKAEEMLS